MTSVIETAAAQGVHSVSPYLTCKGASEAIAFYRRALGAEELTRLDGPDGRIMHACLRINGSSVMLGDEMPECGAMGPAAIGGTPVSMHLLVEDAQAVFRRAVEAGATPVQEPEEMFWGDIFGCFRDPWGHMWSVGQPVREVSGDELREAAGKAFAAPVA